MNKVVIIGGGMGGLTLALALKQKGIPVTVYEKYDHYQSHLTGFLIWSYAIKVLQELGVPIDETGTSLEIFEIHGRNGKVLCEMPIGAVSREYGAESYEINRMLLSRMMSEMVGDDLKKGHECVEVSSTADKAIATFADGTTDEGDLLIGCDGAHSVVRNAIHEGVELNMFNSGGWISVIEPHPQALKPNHHMDFWQPGTKAGVADLGRGTARWYVAFSDRMPDLTVSKKKQIREGMEEVPEVIQQCLDLTDEEDMVPTKAGDLLALTPWYKDRILLIGDAAHATSPYAGMGACAAIADAHFLAQLLASDQSIESVFQQFQDVRKPIADAIIKESRHGLEMSSGRSRLKNWIRDWGLTHIPEKQLHQVVADMVNGH